MPARCFRKPRAFSFSASAARPKAGCDLHHTMTLFAVLTANESHIIKFTAPMTVPLKRRTLE
jgi:hypothetical protein